MGLACVCKSACSRSNEISSLFFVFDNKLKKYLSYTETFGENNSSILKFMCYEKAIPAEVTSKENIADIWMAHGKGTTARFEKWGSLI